MSDRITKQILSHVRHKSYEPAKADKLADELGIDPADRAGFREALDDLVESGQVVIGGGQTIALPPLGREVTGSFRLNERGFGFIIPDTANSHGDLFVPAGQTGDALTGDRVRAAVVHRQGRGPAGHSPYVGRIVQIIERANSVFVGILEQRGSSHVVIPDGRTFTDPIIIRDATAKGAKVGSKVVVELTQYPEGDFLPEGVITEVLGEAGAPDVETESIIRAFSLRTGFPQEVLDEARAVVKRYDAEHERIFAQRKDLRDVFTVTIDPPDAKDFDDAISIDRTADGWTLGVHIADVSAFVAPGSAIDTEAKLRGNSTYLPRRVLPMLPEVLSNGLCSLQPGVPRLARSVFINYDHDGRVQSSRFARAVINSDYRMTYLEAQALIDGDQTEARKHAKTDKPYSPKLLETLALMNDLSRIIRKRRDKQGMISLNLPEVELVFDADGRVVDAQPEDNAYTHKLIEAFMVEANEASARVFADLNVPLIRRVHPDPGAHDIAELRVFAHVAGFNIPANPTRHQLQELLKAVEGKPAARAVSYAVLRTLTKAEYSTAIIGHFALASEHYTHYTSPIRRYTDLTVHRALDALADYLEGFDRIPSKPQQRKRLGDRLRSDDRVGDVDELDKVASHCSGTERNSEAAERALRSFLVMQLLTEHVGEEFDGTVTGVTNFGIYVQIDKFVVDGMIRATDLPGGLAEGWRMNKFTGSMTAQRSGKAITIGDRFKVKLVKVDLVRREMSLMIADPAAIGRGAPQSPMKQKRKKGAPFVPSNNAPGAPGGGGGRRKKSGRPQKPGSRGPAKPHGGKKPGGPRKGKRRGR